MAEGKKIGINGDGNDSANTVDAQIFAELKIGVGRMRMIDTEFIELLICSACP